MTMTTLNVFVDSEVAAAYQSAPIEMQQTYQLMLNMWLRQLTAKPQRDLLAVMDDLSTKAEQRGLTEAELESILNDE